MAKHFEITGNVEKDFAQFQRNSKQTLSDNFYLKRAQQGGPQGGPQGVFGIDGKLPAEWAASVVEQNTLYDQYKEGKVQGSTKSKSVEDVCA